MANADALYDQGRYQAAAAAFTRLAGRPADRANTATRAKIRLARTLVRLDQQPMAVRIAIQAKRATNDANLRRQADFIIGTARYQEGVRGAEAAYDQAEAMAAGGDYGGAEAAFLVLLDRPCPVREDFSARVALRLSNLAVNRGDLVSARQRLAQAGPFKNPELSARAAEIEVRIAQREEDDAALAAAAAADGQMAANDFAGALATRQAALQTHPRASHAVRVRITFDIAGDLTRLNRFDEAFAQITPLQAQGLSPEQAQRASVVLASIRQRQLAYRANLLLEAGDVLRDRGRAKQALALYDSISASSEWPLEWRQRAQLRSASVLRSYDDFRSARTRIAQVAAAPATDALQQSAARASAALDADTPLNSLRGSIEAGVRYDRDPVAETAAIRGEEDLPSSVVNRGEDGSAFLELGAEYRRRLNDRYDYFRVQGDLAATRQFNLDRLDRLSGELRAGPVIHTGLGAAASAGLVVNVTARGGNLLHNDLGGYGEYRSRTAGWDLLGVYDVARREDRRDPYDGWRHRLDVTARPAAARFGPVLTAELGRDLLEDGRNSAWLYGVGGLYRWNLGGDEALSYALETSASVRRVSFDDNRELSDAVFGKRRDVRLRAALALEVTVRSATVVRVEYSHLDIDSNERRRDADNDRIAVSISRRF